MNIKSGIITGSSWFKSKVELEILIEKEGYGVCMMIVSLINLTFYEIKHLSIKSSRFH